MKLYNRLKRQYKLWRMSRKIEKRSGIIFLQKIRCRYLAFKTDQKHYVVYDYRNRIVVINTLMLEQFKKKRLLKRNWDKHIIFESK